MSDNYLPIAETSRMLKTSDFTIRRLIKSRELRAVKVGGQWRVFEADVEEYLAEKENRPMRERASPLEAMAVRP
jgi:excisionase family DNA binding protein